MDMPTDPEQYQADAGTFALLRSLAAGSLASEAALAASSSLSPISLTLALARLAELGVEVETSTDAAGKAIHRLTRPPDLLDAAAVTKSLGATTPFYDVTTIDSCDSTNTRILEGPLVAGVSRVLAAELQSAGRGRRGRTWVSGLFTSLTFSVLRRFDGGMASLSGLSLGVGLAVALAVEELGAQGVMLKWPNDLLFVPENAHRSCANPPAKLGGILIELARESQGATRAVIGIGLNMRLPAAARADVLSAGQPAADLIDAGIEASRNRVLAAVLRHLHAVLATFERDGFAALAAQWSTRHAFQGRAVALLDDGRVEKSGMVAGVADDGALLLATTAGVERVVAGELSLRAAAAS
jgi:BirA family biotin operon repressor/biotin-[acetyl-CoA-carboxylase] ligase